LRKILLICFSLTLLNTGVINMVSATQRSTDEVEHNKPKKISGRVTDVITSAGFTYAEVDTGKGKVWAAGPGITALKKGDLVAFSSEMPMKNFHSKTLGRDFSLIYFIQQYITDKPTSTISTQHGDDDIKNMAQPVITTSNSMPGEVSRGDYLREASLNGLNGENKMLSEFKGKPLIINVWASWCGPCRAEMGSLERLAKQYNGREFNVIGISTDDYQNRAMAFVEQTGITFENYHDSKLILETMLGANTIPLTVLVDEHGRIIEKVRGAREWDSPDIVDAIGRVLHIELTEHVK
jgi:thiol-disulfide isomerase/thioredoxin